MKISDKLKEIMQDINSECNTVSPRALKIYELINYNQTFENAQNLIASFNKRKYSFKYMAAELLWYLSWSLDTDKIWKYAKLWLDIANEDWTVNSNYWYIVLYRFIADYYNQYNYIIEKLKEDKDSRQALIRYNAHEHVYKGNKDFTCTISNQFFIRDNKLDMIVNMRSNDLFFGFQYDIVWFWLVLQSIRLDLLDTYPNLELWNIYYNAGSMHIYESMMMIAREILTEDDWIDYNIILNKSLLKLKKDIQQNWTKYWYDLEKTKDYKQFIKDKFYIDINLNE